MIVCCYFILAIELANTDKLYLIVNITVLNVLWCSYACRQFVPGPLLPARVRVGLALVLFFMQKEGMCSFTL